MNQLVFTIDADVRRRASISYFLNRNGFLAEPFEIIGEFTQHWPKDGIVLVHDHEDAVTSVIHEICRRHAWLPVVAFSENPEPSRIVEAVLAGAVGYVGWPGCDDALIATIRKAKTRWDAASSPGSRRTTAIGRIEKLTRREREILACMVEGLSNRQIGSQLSISPRTVELHRANMLNKIGVRRSAEAIRIAIEASLPAFDLETDNALI